MHMTTTTPFLIVVITLLSAVLLTSCDELLTGQVIREDSDSFEEVYLRCADGAGLHVDDMCIDGRVLKVLIRNNRQARIESVFFIFHDGDEEHTVERHITMDVGSQRMLDQRTPEQFDSFIIRPTYRVFDGSFLGCSELEMDLEEVRRCSRGDGNLE